MDRTIAKTTEKAEVKSFNKPDELREFPNGRVEIVNLGGATIGRATFKPGWKWSTSVQPIAKTKSCEAPHFQYQIAGTLVVKMDDGTLIKTHAGDVAIFPPGHDAWVEGNENVVAVDFHGMVNYAKAQGSKRI